MSMPDAPQIAPFEIDDTINHRTLRITFDDDGTAMLWIFSGDGMDEVHKVGIEITVDDDLVRLFEHAKPLIDFLIYEEERELKEIELEKQQSN